MYLSRIAFIFTLMVMVACGSDRQNPDMSDDMGTPDIQQNQMNNTQTATPPPTAEPAQNADGVWHYTCPNGCEGGSGSAGMCENCGAQLQHNTAYHSNAQEQVQNPVNATEGMQQQIQMQQGTPPQAEPAQNANGVWHYTCPNGCEGGSGSPTACANCGAQLQHNAAYHQ